MSTKFEEFLRAEMGRAEASPRPGLVREAHQSYRRHKKLRRRAGLAVTGCVAAVAAAATVIALPSNASRPGASPRAGLTAGAQAEHGGTVRLTAPPVTATFTAATDVTAAHVLVKAARDVQTAHAGGVPLARGWPDATYWHTLSQATNSACPGQVVTSNTWLAKAGYAIVDSTATGPKASGPTSACAAVATAPYTVMGEGDGAQIGGKSYTWSQFAALPTDPARLWPIVKADASVGVARTKGGLSFDFDTIGILLSSDPVSPAMQKALYTVMERFPGVTVAGTYTDSLGRTGTALRSGTSTIVIDSRNGQVLAQVEGVPPHWKTGCTQHRDTYGNPYTVCNYGGASITVFISAGPATSAPKVKGFNTKSFAMPSLIGDTLGQAEKATAKTELGLVLIDTIGTRSSSNRTDKVVAQSPAAGTMVAPGTQPTITVKP